MRKSFLFNVFFMVFVNFLIKPFWVFGIDRTIQNKLGEAEYGLFFAIFNFTFLFQILLDFGLQNYNNREIATDNKKINELLPTILLFKSILIFLYLVICIAVAYPLGYLSKSFIWIIMANQILVSTNIYLRTNISAHQLFIKDALLSVLDKLLMILFCAVLIWGNIPSLKLTIFNFAIAQMLAYLITFLVCLYYSVKLTTQLKFKFDIYLFKNIARTTLPYAIIHFLMTTYYRIDGVMLQKLQGENGNFESGVYAQGYRIMESLNNIAYLLSTILLPVFAYKIAQKQDIKPILKSSFNIIFCIATSLVIGLFYYRFEIIDLMYHSSIDTLYSSNVFGFLLLNFFPVAILYVISTLLTANLNFKRMIYTLIIAVLLNIGLNFYLITKSGALGAGQATLITQLFMLICYSMFCYKIFNLNFNFKYIARLLSFILLSFIDLYLVQTIQLKTDTNTFLLQILLYFLFTPFNAYITGLITLNTLKLKVGVEQ